jgi:tetratricopeptide (TPR) repeat protein
MKFLARLMSHGFAVVLVVLLAIGFINRGTLFPGWELPGFLAFDSEEGTTDGTQAEKIEPAPLQEDDWMASIPATGDQQAPDVGDDDAASMADVSDAMPPVEEVAESSAAVIAESAPADASEAVEASETEMPAAPAVEEDTPAREAPAATEVMEEPATLDLQESVEEVVVPAPEVVTAPDVVESDTAGSGSVAESAAPMPSAAEPIAESEMAAQGSASQAGADETISYYQLLASAREAYWLRDYQAAEDFYRRMITDDPDNPDGYGELGNMYFSQGNWEAASSAYYEAGSRLVKSGLLAPARDLVDVIRGLNGSQADALDQEIKAARESSQ